ncbi:MAG: hypothetical protein Q8K68_10490 [Nitrospirota bacterium]|nr:hypothetical protein [Nitrospirota bacterium]
MRVSLCKKSIISIQRPDGFIAHLREIAQLFKKSVFFRYDAHIPFLKSRLPYIMFVLFFTVYAVSPLRMAADSSLKGLQQNSAASSARIMLVERLLEKLTDVTSLNELNISDDASTLEVMVKKKRALLRSFTLLFLLLMAIAAHSAAKFIISNELITPPNRFRHSQSTEHINISDVYLSPHSGLSPPYLLS